MPVANFTAKWVERIPAPIAGRVDYFDERLKGLGLRISHVGKKVWFVMFRVKGDPTKRRLTLDSYPSMTLADARQAAQNAIITAQRGQDPALEKQDHKRAATFAVLAREYIERYAKPKKRSWREDARVIGHDLLPVWKRKKASDIKRQDVLTLLNSIVDRGSPIQANRTLALARKIFNWGIGRGIVEHNPCHMVERPSKENRRDRVLSESEITAVWRAFNNLGQNPGRDVQIAPADRAKGRRSAIHELAGY